MAAEIGIGLLGVGLGLGLRHGIDWDHIAAITDVTSAQPSRLRGLAMGSLYAAGHAAVVIALGILAIAAATQMPNWVDSYMETVVGITLVTLGLWVFYSLIRHPDHFMLKSRWMLLFSAVRTGGRWARSKLTGRTYVSARASSGYYGAGASTGIGMIHGIGAETGSQALLIAGAAGATSAAAGSFLLIAFAVGLVLSNTLITIASTMGVLGSQSRRVFYLGLGVLIGSFSLVIGTVFLLQKGSILPGFFA
jgi:high-affinity nickel-transport protein